MCKHRIKFKLALCRFRVSVHVLAIEAGRWHELNKIPYNEMSIMQYFRR